MPGRSHEQLWRRCPSATPIRTEGGTVASVVVIAQDLAPLEEVERQRAEFLGLVSHELREPLAAISFTLFSTQNLSSLE